MAGGAIIRAGMNPALKFFTGAFSKAAPAAATKAAPQLTRFAAGPFMKQVLGIGLGTAGLGLVSGIPGYRDKMI